MHTLQILRIQICIESLIAVLKTEKYRGNPTIKHCIILFPIKLHFGGRLRRFVFVNPLPFVLNIVLKDPLFVTGNDILEKRVIFLLWKKTCYRFVIYFIFLIKSMRNPNTQLDPFFYLFQVVTDCGFWCTEVKCWFFRVTSINSLKAYWSKSV